VLICSCGEEGNSNVATAGIGGYAATAGTSAQQTSGVVTGTGGAIAAGGNTAATVAGSTTLGSGGIVGAAGSAKAGSGGISGMPATTGTAGTSAIGQFVKVKGTEFIAGGQPYAYVGANFWQAMNLASKGPGGNREQLIRELDNLKSKGVTNIRIIAASEGPDTEPYRAIPALMKSPGQYDDALWDGLDFLLKEMGSRGMRAVMVLGNFWHWSGGFGQYLVWAGTATSIPYPPPAQNGNWDTYQKFCAQFYGTQKAVDYYQQHIKTVITRANSYTHTLYRDDPTIMAWELANEPRGMDKFDDYKKWISATADFIKGHDPNHLVTTGSEGDTAYPDSSNTEYSASHSFPNIDYGTAHFWIQNWNWYDPSKPEDTNVGLEPALAKAKAYIDSHVKKAAALKKPIVFEEFGIARDANSYDPSSTVRWRDKYYEAVLSYMLTYAQKGELAGINFWAWSGESRPVPPYGSYWKVGDPFLGDPPHENQGWYGVYDKDTSTIGIISKYSGKINE
jgi:mannan endo-1,4-beta-mannosidase